MLSLELLFKLKFKLLETSYEMTVGGFMSEGALTRCNLFSKSFEY